MMKILKPVQLVSLLVLLASVAYIGVFVAHRKGNDLSVAADPAGDREADAVTDSIVPADDSLESYTNKIASRDIFSSASPSVPFVPSAGETELPVNLKVVGIVVGKPSEIIIEDSSVHQTYFIPEGQSQGGITLQKISDGSALLLSQGKTVVVKIKGTRADP